MHLQFCPCDIRTTSTVKCISSWTYNFPHFHAIVRENNSFAHPPPPRTLLHSLCHRGWCSPVREIWISHCVHKCLQWLIQDFPNGEGAPTPEFWAKKYLLFDKIFPEMKEIGPRDGGGSGGGIPSAPFPGSANVFRYSTPIRVVLKGFSL